MQRRRKFEPMSKRKHRLVLNISSARKEARDNLQQQQSMQHPDAIGLVSSGSGSCDSGITRADYHRIPQGITAKRQSKYQHWTSRSWTLKWVRECFTTKIKVCHEHQQTGNFFQKTVWNRDSTPKSNSIHFNSDNSAESRQHKTSTTKTEKSIGINLKR